MNEKSNVFTPDNIAELMSSFLKKHGNLLDPAVGNGALLKHTKLYPIDAYDINKNFLDEINDRRVTKHHKDFLKTDILKFYDNIIMNPPYIRIQDLKEKDREYIRQNMDIVNRGNFDIYLAFLLKGLFLLKGTGVMVAITPNSYLYSKSCKNFRKHLIDFRFVDKIIDFQSEKVFPGVSVYCCITVFNRKPKTKLTYINKQTDEIKEIKYCDIDDNFFENKMKKEKLEKYINISIGVATLRDKVFIHKEKLFDEPCWKQIFKVSKNKKLWIIYPYNSGKSIMSEEMFKTLNPQTYEYLLSNKEELAKRDKGNKKYEAWYAYGRKQGFKMLNIPTKVLYIPTLANKEFKIIEDDTMLFYGGYCISQKIPEYPLSKIKEIIEKNKEYIYRNSSKRGNDWFNLSSLTIRNISAA